MVGTDLNLTLPDSGESMATNIQRIAVALAAIEDSLADLVTQAGININGTFELNGNLLSEVASVQFASGNVNNVAGCMYYYDGEFYLVDTTGTIKLTDNGQINLTGTGGIVGDYGTGPEAVTYVNSSGQYIFTEDTGIYADIVADDLHLVGSAGTLILGTAAGLTGTRSVLFGAIPSSGVGAFVYDTGDNTLKDASVTRETLTHKFTAIDCSSTVTCSDLKHGDQVLLLPATHGRANSGIQYDFNPEAITTTATALVHYPLPLKVGDRIKSVTLKVYGNGVTDLTATIRQTTSDMLGDSVLGTTTLNDAGFAWQDVTVDCTDTTLENEQSLSLIVNLTGSGFRIGNIRVTYDRP